MYREPFQADIALRFGGALQRMGELALDKARKHAPDLELDAVTHIEDSVLLVQTILGHVREDLEQTDLSESFHAYTPAECDIAGRWLQTYTQLNKGWQNWLNDTIDLDWTDEQWDERAELRRWTRQMADWLHELGMALPIEYVRNDYTWVDLN